MKPTQSFTLIALFAACLTLPAFAQTPAPISTPDKVETGIKVTPETFIRAETDRTFNNTTLLSR